MSEVREGMEFLQGFVFNPDVEVGEQRARLDAALAAREVSAGFAVSESEVGGVPCRALAPAGAVDGRAIVYAHGGGYCVARPALGDALGERLSRDLGATWLGVDYRLAPEHPAPAAVEDVAAVLGATPGAVAVGDSAGAGALVAAIAAGAPAGALVLVCPWLDLTAAHPDPGEPPLSGRWLAACAAAYAPRDRGGALASPGRHPWRVGVPTLVVAAGRDPLLADARALEGEAGVEVRVWGDALHDFALLAGADGDADEAAEAIAGFVGRVMGWARADGGVTG